MSELMTGSPAGAAGKYHEMGFNCAESIFLAFRELAAPELGEDMVKIATPFGGGMGRAGCVCGALSGAMLILGAARGRTDPSVPRKESYSLSQEYHNMFKERFGATCCRILVKHEFGSREQGERCYKIITESADMMYGFLKGKGIVKE